MYIAINFVSSVTTIDSGLGVKKWRRPLVKSMTKSFLLVLETGEVGMEAIRKANAVDTAANHKRTWKLNCTIWAQVDQQHRKKQYADADCDVIGALSVQVRDCWVCIYHNTYE